MRFAFFQVYIKHKFRHSGEKQRAAIRALYCPQLLPGRACDIHNTAHRFLRAAIAYFNNRKPHKVMEIDFTITQRGESICRNQQCSAAQQLRCIAVLNAFKKNEQTGMVSAPGGDFAAQGRASPGLKVEFALHKPGGFSVIVNTDLPPDTVCLGNCANRQKCFFRHAVYLIVRVKYGQQSGQFAFSQSTKPQATCSS